MSALTEQLTQHLDKLDSDGGLSTLHLLSLPNSINRILRLFLKSKQVSYDALLKAIADTPHEDRMVPEDLDVMLQMLCDREWLIKSEMEGQTFYGINLRPAVASASAKAEQNETAKELWEKAEMDSAGSSGKSSSQLHADITGKIKIDRSDTPNTQEKTGDTKEQKNLTADDLWDVLD